MRHTFAILILLHQMNDEDCFTEETFNLHKINVALDECDGNASLGMEDASGDGRSHGNAISQLFSRRL